MKWFYFILGLIFLLSGLFAMLSQKISFGNRFHSDHQWTISGGGAIVLGGMIAAMGAFILHEIFKEGLHNTRQSVS